VGHNGSGDLFLAFATGNHIPVAGTAAFQLTALRNYQLNPFFAAVAEAVEEAILNALTAAETMMGWQGRVAYALPLDTLQQVMAAYGRKVSH
jgi:D-aminopeptidase